MLLLLFGYVCHLVFWVGLLHTPRVSMGILFFFVFFSGGAVALGPNNLWSTPPTQKSNIGTTLKEFPSVPKLVMLCRHVML